MGGRRDGALVTAGVAGRIRVIGVDVSGFVLDAFFSIRAVSIRAFVPVVRAVLAPIAVAVLMGGRRDRALVAAGVAGRIRVIGVDVRGLVLDAFFSIRAVIVGAFVPVARAVLAPVAVAVLVGGRRDGALVAANIAGHIRVIGVDVCSLVIDAFFPIRAVIVGALVPVVRAVPAPIAVAVLMGGWRDGALVAANIAGRIRVIVIDVCGLVIDAFFPIRAVIVGAFVPVACAVLAPIAVAVLMRGRRGLGYRNRQLLRIAARAVGSLDGEAGGSLRSGRAADLAGGFVQRQVGREIATVNAPCDRRSAGGGQGLAVRLAHLAVWQGVRGDGGGGGSVFADGEVVLRLAAVVPRAVQRHLGGFCRVKALVVRCEGVGMDVVGIAGGVVRVLRKLLRFVLARLMGKPRQLLFAAVMGAVRQPLHRQKPMLIAVSKIILAADLTFPVFVRAMLNARSVDGAAADGDVFRRNTGQLLCVQVVIDIACAPLFRKPEGVHRAVQDLDSNLRSPAERIFPDAGNIVSGSPQIAALCGHGAVFNDDIYSTAAGVPRCADGGAELCAANEHLTVRNADTALAIEIDLLTVTDGRI